MKKNLYVHVVGVGIALLALVVYVLTLSHGAAPGASSGYILSILGQYPRLIPLSPFWFACMRGLTALSGSHAVAILNASSAVFGSIAVWLMYDLMRVGLPMWMDTYQFEEKRRRLVGLLAGVLAAVSLAFCIPFWSVANRAHMGAFDVMLLLAAARVLLLSITSGRYVYLAVLTLLYGFLAAQFSSMLVFAPMFAIGGLYALWRHDALQPWRIALLCGLLALGLLVAYPLSALGFYGSEGYVLRELDGFWHVLWQIWRHQFLLLSRRLPREGWLIILVTTTIPWLTMFAVARRGLNEDRDWGLLLLHAIMTALVSGIWLNVQLAPWAMLGWQRLLVTPYVLTAMVTGYLGAFWFIAAGKWQSARESGVLAMLRYCVASALAVGLLLLALLVPWWHVQAARPPASEDLAEVVDAVLDSLEDRTWLVSDGNLDSQYLIRAWERGMPLKLINLSSGSQPLYLRYVAGLFEDVGLQNAAMLSLPALLREWLQDATAAEDVAILSEASVWRRLGYEPIPQGMVYVGAKPDALPPLDALATDQLAFLDRVAARLSGDEWSDAQGSVREWGIRHAGRLANDMAVLLEDHGHDALAVRLYQRVRQLDPDNVSALLNLVAMVEADRAQDPEGEIAAALAALEASLTKRYRIWSLSRTYGIVRSPAAFAQMGWTWAYSGQPGLAAMQMERASALAGDQHASGMDALRAKVYLLDNRPVESGMIYRDMLQDEDRRLTGLMGLYQLAIREDRPEVGRDLLQRASEAGLASQRFVLESALLDLMQGRASDAVERLEPLVLDQRGLLRAWVLLAEAGIALEDERLLNRALRRIEMIEGTRGYFTSILRARQAFEGLDYALAAEYYKTALAQRPGHLPVIEELLRLNLMLQRRQPAQGYMKMLLAQDPDHALALYVRGSLQMAAGEYRLAEDSLRRSLRAERLTMALNDLSWLLLQREAWEEAEALAQEALARNADQPAVWDTLGVLYRRTGRMEQAQEAFRRSLALAPGNVLVHLHLAQLQLQEGSLAPVRELVSRLEPDRERLSGRQLEIWQQLREAVR